MAKRIFGTLFLLVMTVFAFVWYQNVYLEPCAKPIKYSIGSIDSKFGLGAVEFLDDVAKAETVWEKAVGRDLFAYQPDASFKINLIYDERQRSIILKQREESGLEAAESILRQTDSRLREMRLNYEQSAAAHEAALSALESDQSAYQSEVDYWNLRGGAPPKEFAALEKKRLALNAEVEKVNSQAAALNQKQEELNALVRERNAAAVDYNRLVKNYNERYASGLEFDQAEYTGEAINIYEFKNRSDLELVLAHELGHALGLGHVENSRSVMYYLSGGQDRLLLSEEDLAELNRICEIK